MDWLSFAIVIACLLISAFLFGAEAPEHHPEKRMQAFRKRGSSSIETGVRIGLQRDRT
jgi:hypothetical protein